MTEIKNSIHLIREDEENIKKNIEWMEKNWWKLKLEVIFLFIILGVVQWYTATHIYHLW
jgi:hypothetical protein